MVNCEKQKLCVNFNYTSKTIQYLAMSTIINPVMETVA